MKTLSSNWLGQGCALLLLVFVAAASVASSPPLKEIIVCGWDEVFILDLAQTPPAQVWSWKAANRPELPESIRDKFKTTDECKPVDHGARVLITSSSDGVALVERASGKVLFYGTAGGAHSAEMLPRGRIVVASSTSKNELADSLVLFDVKQSGKALFHTELVSGHGVVWDEGRRLLWALNGKLLRTYRLAAWDTSQPSLEKTHEYVLPEDGGHDLSLIPGTDQFSVTTLHRAWVFDRERHSFSLHPELGDKVGVKSITVHPVTKQTVWTQADKGFWWTATIRLLNPEQTIERKGERLYKARWMMAPSGGAGK